MVKIIDVKVHLLPVDFRTWVLIKVETDIDEAFLARLAGRAEPLITETAWDPDGSVADW